MHPLIRCLGLLVFAVLSACGGETASESQSVLPCPNPTEATSDSPPPSLDRCVQGTGVGGQAGGASAAVPGGGTANAILPTGTPAAGQSGGASGAAPGGGAGSSIRRTWSESVTQRGDGTSSVITQQYEATVNVSLTQVDEGAWTLAGTANIVSAFTSDWVSRQTSSLGPCNVHYTDDAAASGTVAVEGGLEARDGFYNFYVNIPGVDGGNDTVRDDSGCNGPNNQERTPWSAAPITASGSGEMTSPRTISGSSSAPREGGEDTLTWSFALPQ